MTMKARRETMAKERWRVQVWLGPIVTHESKGSEKAMRDYFETLEVSDSRMLLQRRIAGNGRYDNIEAKHGPETRTLATLDLDLQVRGLDRATMSQITSELRTILDGWGYDYFLKERS